MTEATTGASLGRGGGTVGVIGLGLLGSAIVERLVGSGYTVVGHDVDATRADALGVAASESPASLSQRVERVLLCLPDSEVVERVVSGESGLITGDTGLRHVVDTTTGAPDRGVALAERLRARGIGYVDATVSGSSSMMRQGGATLLVGATEDDLAAVRDVLDALAAVVFHLGPPGKGLQAKLVSNLVLGLNRLALAEGLVLGEKVGIDPGVMIEVLRASPAHSRALEAKGEKMVSGDYEPQARLAQHLKDVELIIALGAAAGVSLPLSQKHRDVLRRAAELGFGDADNSAVIEALR